jgi:uncharacterized protein
MRPAEQLPRDLVRYGTARRSLAAEFCAAIADDELRVIEVTPHDYRRMAELLTTYSSLRLQVVDACVIALAEPVAGRARAGSATR